MSEPDDTRLAEVQLLVEESMVVVEKQKAIVLELQRKGEDASAAKRLLLRCIEILTIHQEEMDRVRQTSNA